MGVTSAERTPLQVQGELPEAYEPGRGNRHSHSQTMRPSRPRFTLMSANFHRTVVTSPAVPASISASGGLSAGARHGRDPRKGPKRMDTITSLPDLWAALPELAAEARARATEFEARRSLAPDFADRLKRAGIFKILVPADVQGLGASLTEWLEIVMTLAEADASTGWVSAHAGICAGLIYASAEPRFREEFFADPGACAAWSNQPRVTVTEQEDGIRITGSWAFETGCTAATFVGGMVLLSPPAEGAPPRVVAAMAPIGAARIEETWDPVGLAGTGSHDVHFDDVFVPWYRTFPWPAGIPVSAYPAA